MMFVYGFLAGEIFCAILAFCLLQSLKKDTDYWYEDSKKWMNEYWELRQKINAKNN